MVSTDTVEIAVMESAVEVDADDPASKESKRLLKSPSFVEEAASMIVIEKTSSPRSRDLPESDRSPTISDKAVESSPPGASSLPEASLAASEAILSPKPRMSDGAVMFSSVAPWKGTPPTTGTLRKKNSSVGTQALLAAAAVEKFEKEDAGWRKRTASSAVLEARGSITGSFGRSGSMGFDPSDAITSPVPLLSSLTETFIEKTAKEAPLCDACCSDLIKELEASFAEENAMFGCYTDRNLQLDLLLDSSMDGTADDTASGSLDLAGTAVLAQLHALQAEEAALAAELDSLRAIGDHSKQRSKDVRRATSESEVLTSTLLLEANKWTDKLNQCKLDRRSVNLLLRSDSVTLGQLRNTNVFNDAFHIWHEGPFGTINGFRLGRLPAIVVDWNEVNAAWGLVALLLKTMATEVDFEFESGDIIVIGSYSKVRHGKSKTMNPLYWDGSFFGKSAFNSAMFDFLKCLEEISKFAMSTDKAIRLPYDIDGHKIGGMSIRYGAEEQWTKALKYTLTNIKWLLAWCSKS